MIRIWMPFPPSVNNLNRDLSPEQRARIEAGMRAKGKRGRAPTRVLTPAYRRWCKDADTYIRLVSRPPRFSEAVDIINELEARDNRARDADNYNKPILDALVRCKVLPDDSARFVRSVRAVWLPANPKKPGITCCVRIATEPFPTLTPAERRVLASLSSTAPALFAPRPSEELKSLIQKGFVTEVVGLFPDHVIGYQLREWPEPL
jgi:Holliday junction resolvase RusA-like endonuclease